MGPATIWTLTRTIPGLQAESPPVPPRPPPAPAAAVSATDLVLSYGSRTALAPASFEFLAGSSVSLIGPNGSGKSTLLRGIAGLMPPRDGRLQVPSRGAPGAVALVLQTTDVDRSLPITVRETVTMARYARKGPFARLDRGDRAAINSSLERLGVADLAMRQLHELSGGQRQRVLVAQGLAQEADLLLLADRVMLLANRLVAFGAPDEVLTDRPLAAAYGGRVLALPEGVVVMDDPHHNHHDDHQTGHHSDRHRV